MLHIRPIPETTHLWALLGHTVALCLAFAGIVALDDPSAPTGASWLLVRLPAMAALGLLAGTRLRALGNVQHETCHNLFLASPKHNRRLGLVIGIILFQPHTSYALDHVSHHRCLGKGNADRDLARYEGVLPSQGTANRLWAQWRLAASWPCLRVALRFRIWCARDPWPCNAGRCLWLGCLVAALMGLIAAGQILAAALTVLVFGLVYPFFCVWSDIADHVLRERQGSRPGQIFRHARNHIFAWHPLNLLLQPRSDAYHLVHHLRPNIPVSGLAEEHEKLCARYPAYACLQHTLRVRPTWSEQNKKAGH